MQPELETPIDKDHESPPRGKRSRAGSAALEQSMVSCEVAPTIREVMIYLLKAHEYAAESKVDNWDFAVELPGLRDCGINLNDLRWIVASGWLEQAEEVTTPGDQRRAFRHGGFLAFGERTCFVLSERGVMIARTMRDELAANPPAVVAQTVSANGSDNREVQKKPLWDADLQQLRLGDRLVKEFKLPSPNQTTILGAFQEEDWPPRIDDPLPMCPHVGSKERLRYTIKSLNKHQKNRMIRFRGDGRGEGICWEVWPQAYDAERLAPVRFK